MTVGPCLSRFGAVGRVGAPESHCADKRGVLLGFGNFVVSGGTALGEHAGTR